LLKPGAGAHRFVADRAERPDAADRATAGFPARKKQLVPSGEALKRFSMAGQGSTGNVIAALCSFFIPGLGQLIQGRLLMALIQFVLAGLLWFVLLGWLVHLWSILDAAMFKPRA
jgi:hypothetical protein